MTVYGFKNRDTAVRLRGIAENRTLMPEVPTPLAPMHGEGWVFHAPNGIGAANGLVPGVADDCVAQIYNPDTGVLEPVTDKDNQPIVVSIYNIGKVSVPVGAYRTAVNVGGVPVATNQPLTCDEYCQICPPLATQTGECETHLSRVSVIISELEDETVSPFRRYSLANGLYERSDYLTPTRTRIDCNGVIWDPATGDQLICDLINDQGDQWFTLEMFASDVRWFVKLRWGANGPGTPGDFVVDLGSDLGDAAVGSRNFIKSGVSGRVDWDACSADPDWTGSGGSNKVCPAM